MSLADTTCLIPLYRSKRLLPYVYGTIDSHIALGGHVICSDEHGLDEAADLIAARYDGNPQVTVMTALGDGGNWVSNCNRLMSACRTPYFRIAPHDDSVDGSSTDILAQVLRNRSDVILSHGWVRAETEEGVRLPDRDEPRFPLNPSGDRLTFSAGLFWQGLFAGAFKAVIRSNADAGRPLLIRPTPSLKHSERAWLFGLSLLGEFAFSPEAFLIKRYWQGSLTEGWRIDSEDQIETARVMACYAVDHVPDPDVRQALVFNLFLNASRRAAWLDGLTATRPVFEAPVLPEGGRG